MTIVVLCPEVWSLGKQCVGLMPGWSLSLYKTVSGPKGHTMVEFYSIYEHIIQNIAKFYIIYVHIDHTTVEFYITYVHIVQRERGVIYRLL